MKETFGVWGQWLGLTVCGSGLICELITKADFYYALITLGAIIFAVSTKIRGR